MSTAQKFLYLDNTSQPNFQQWAKGISDQLTAAGWTKTADTGQVDWSTNPAVPASGSYVYEIRQPASDPLQLSGGVPTAQAFYLKIEYGSLGGPSPSLRFSVGTGTNAAGTLTGYIIGPYTPCWGGANYGVTAYECDFSWDVSRLAMCLWRNHPDTSFSVFVSFERTHNSDGTDSTDGVTMNVMSRATGTFQRTIAFGVGLAPEIGNNAWCTILQQITGSGGISAFNNNLPVAPIFPMYGKYGNPLKGICSIHGSETSNGVQFTTTLYGTTHTYMVLFCFYAQVTDRTAGVPAMLWE